MDIGGWLRSLGLERHEAAFRENAIDADVLRDLTDEDLEKLGVLLGDRRRLLRAIAALDGASAAASSPAPVSPASAASPTSSTVEVSREYRNVTTMFCDVLNKVIAYEERAQIFRKHFLGSLIQKQEWPAYRAPNLKRDPHGATSVPLPGPAPATFAILVRLRCPSQSARAEAMRR
jgi:hypothetical protein